MMGLSSVGGMAMGLALGWLLAGVAWSGRAGARRVMFAIAGAGSLALEAHLLGGLASAGLSLAGTAAGLALHLAWRSELRRSVNRHRSHEIGGRT